jgi:hypothetical protein
MNPAPSLGHERLRFRGRQRRFASPSGHSSPPDPTNADPAKAASVTQCDTCHCRPPCSGSAWPGLETSPSHSFWLTATGRFWHYGGPGKATGATFYLGRQFVRKCSVFGRRPVRVRVLAGAICSAGLLAIGCVTAFSTTDAVAAHSARKGLATGLCPGAQDTSRGGVPKNFIIDACVTNNVVWLRNSTQFAVLVTPTGSASKLSHDQSAVSIASKITRLEYSQANLLLPGDSGHVPIGAGIATVTVAGAQHISTFWAVTSYVDKILPLPKAVDISKSSAESVLDLTDEINDDLWQYSDCVGDAGKSGVKKAACRALLVRNLTFAVGRSAFHVAISAAKVNSLVGFVEANWDLAKAVPSIAASLSANLTISFSAQRTPPTTTTQPPTTRTDPPTATTQPPTTTTNPPMTGTPAVSLAQGPAAPAGYRYAVTLSGFPANSGVSIECYDSVSPSGFYNFTLTTNAAGAASSAAWCYSGDGPDHWVIAGGVESNHVSPPPPPPPAASITASLGGTYGCGVCHALNVAVRNFPTGTYTYTCHDNSGPGGSDSAFYSHAVSITDPNQSGWPGVFCYDSAPYSAYVVINGVSSNRVQY